VYLACPSGMRNQAARNVRMAGKSDFRGEHITTEVRRLVRLNLKCDCLKAGTKNGYL